MVKIRDSIARRLTKQTSLLFAGSRRLWTVSRRKTPRGATRCSLTLSYQHQLPAATETVAIKDVVRVVTLSTSIKFTLIIYLFLFFF